MSSPSVSAPASLHRAVQPLTCYDLRCDGEASPLGVDAAPPRLSWKLRGEGRGRRQTAYQVQAATARAALADGNVDAWDSGRVASDQQTFLRYGGRPLRSSEEIFWRVRVWDETGGESAWSEIATWTMGVLTPADWQAKWITDAELLKWVRPQWGYRSEPAATAETTKWITLDLGAERTIDEVHLYGVRYGDVEWLGFPQRFKIEGATQADFREVVTLVDQTAEDFPWNYHVCAVRPVPSTTVRYVRLTVTKLHGDGHGFYLRLSQIAVLAGGVNIAAGATVTASDSEESERWSVAALVDGKVMRGANPRDNATLLARRTFTVRRGLKRALLHVCGLGHHELSINGARVGLDLLAPGWTTYTKTCLYDTHDITPLVREGANGAGVFLGSGFYNVRPGRYLKLENAFRPLTVIAQLRFEYADGTVEIVGTDERWQVREGPTTFASVYGGEDHDARLEQAGWDTAAADVAGWTSAVTHAGPGGELRGFSHAAPPMRAFETLRPVGVRTLRPGVQVFDFGQNASIMPRLTVRGSRGATVTLIPAELAHPDGSIDRASINGVGSGGTGLSDSWWRYTLAGRGDEETWFPRFFYHGGRYLEARLTPGEDGVLPHIVALESVVVHSASPATGDFACASDLFNRIRPLIRWAQRSNLAHVITDCPHREKLGWLEQYHLNGPSLRYEFDLTRMFLKTFDDMADAQLANGLVPDIAPEYIQFSEGFRDSPEWGSALILAAWQHFEWTGDDTPLRRHYGAMKRYLAHLASQAEGHILSHGLGDWCDLGPGRPAFAQLTPVALTATAFYFLDTRVMAKIAGHLGETADAATLAQQADVIREAFNAKFFDAASGSYATGSQCANALPLASGLVAPENRAAVLDAIVRDVRGRGDALTAGDVGFRYLLQALAENGRSDVVQAMNAQSEKPGYGYQLKLGCTSLAESWHAARDLSHNHFMLGHIMEWFYRDLAGLAPDVSGPGFARVQIRPQPVAGISWARAEQKSARGRVAVAWRIAAGQLLVEVELPPNTTGIVTLPGGAEQATEGGRALGGRDDVRAVTATDGAVSCEVGSGSYRFAVPRRSGG
ncbi:family 78 glycoside hydrolase catalytic domain [Horticoccus luteus]|uniref:alpha-L-rhamnosidase n=1 Tax=Horticoccus luteus TaxID=2862869 RepID=A0A8F9TWQ0_9BACT|nr:family 78 glycoside hydrolase catalytic domain [Horticoccus luteus]QYM78947.1 family 78 glycoside hydrolase catalytic domain [Horticoccus luteus]